MTPILPVEIVDMVLKFLEPSNIDQASFEDLQNYARPFAAVSYGDRAYREYFAKFLHKLRDAAAAKKIKDFQITHLIFTSLRKLSGSTYKAKKAATPLALHQSLFTILQTKSRFLNPVKHIQDFTRLILSYDGCIKPLKEKTALQVACENQDLSLEVIDFLLQAGEKPFRIWEAQFKGRAHWRRNKISSENPFQSDSFSRNKRVAAIQRLFVKYMDPTLPNLSSMPLEVKEWIVLCFAPPSLLNHQLKDEVKMSCQEISHCARQFLNLALVDKNFCMIITKTSKVLLFLQQLWEVRREQDLMKKYPHYDHPSYPEERPYLLDALCSGCPFPFTKHTFEEFTEETEQDVQVLLTLPQKRYQIDKLSTTDFKISALGAACINPRVSLQLVKTILDKVDETLGCRIWYLTEQPWYTPEGDDLLKEVERLRPYVEWDRFDDIYAIFTEYVDFVTNRDEERSANAGEAEESYSKWRND